MDAIVRPIAKSYQFTDYTIGLVLGDVSDEDACRRTREGEGPSISWIVGHLYDYRCLALELLGLTTERKFRKLFGEASASDGDGYPGIPEWSDLWNRQAERLQSALKEFPEARMLRPIDPEHPESGTPLDTFAFYNWHEAYHMGSLGMIRRELGYPATSGIEGSVG